MAVSIPQEYEERMKKDLFRLTISVIVLALSLLVMSSLAYVVCLFLIAYVK